jgi:predicted helicase
MDPRLSEYLNALKSRLQGATEHTYRPALQALLEGLAKGLYPSGNVKVLNDPKRTGAGAPDFVVILERESTLYENPPPLILGHVETKALGIDLDRLRGREEEQRERYRKAFPNLLYTNYLDFILYREGREVARATLDRRKGKSLIPAGEKEVLVLLQRFLGYEGEKISKADALTAQLAAHAQLLRAAIDQALQSEEAKEDLEYWQEVFRKSLLPDLQASEFADLLAQTLTYGLFTARLYHRPGHPFTFREAFWSLPNTNPFLKDLFQSLAPKLAEEPRIAWVLESLSDILERTDIEAILDHFARGGRSDPVLHFYEGFLQSYDPNKRELRGVYYTPDPVVRFIVRGVDWLLKEKFSLSEGLAEDKVYFLDPATGTGTFLYHVILGIHERFSSRGEALWRRYAQEKLTQRLFGLELMMVPYTVAHLKLALELERLGAKPQGRLAIYLANTLEDPDRDPQLQEVPPFLKGEAEGAYQVRRHQPILVILGNPPYSGHSANKMDWIKKLVQDYYKVDGQTLEERNPKWLQDDYVKFIRWGEWRLAKVEPGYGMLAYVTNHAYISNPTFRGMRRHLLRTFDEIYILNLHGNKRRKEKAPDGGPDESVFDIQQGVAIAFFLRYPEGKHRDDALARVFYADLWGTRGRKEDYLNSTPFHKVPWQEVSPKAPFYIFAPKDQSLAEEYERGWSLPDIFPVNSVGIVTARDHFAIAFTEKELQERIEAFCDKTKSDQEVRREFFGETDPGAKYPAGDNRDWQMEKARKELCKDPHWREHIKPILYRPFDCRSIIYHRAAIDFGRWELMQNMLEGENRALLSVRQISSQAWKHVFCSKGLAGANCISAQSKEIGYVFPLFTYLNSFGHRKVKPNLSEKFVKALEESTGLTFEPQPEPLLAPGREERFTPFDVLAYIYAVLHTPSYREKHLDFLEYDFPRIPLPGNQGVFLDLVGIGRQLLRLHTLEGVPEPNVRFEGKKDDQVKQKQEDDQVKQVRFEESPLHGEGKVWINTSLRFEGVPKAAWEWQVGGYRPLEKYLKDRIGRILSSEEIELYRKMVMVAVETLRLEEELEALKWLV